MKNKKRRPIVIMFRLNYLIIKQLILILLLVEEKVLLGRVVGPDVFDGFVDFAVVLKFGEILDDLLGGAGTVGIVDKFFL